MMKTKLNAYIENSNFEFVSNFGFRISNFLLLLLLAATLTACSQKETETTPPAQLLKGEEEVLARVNGSPITVYDVDLAIRTSLGGASAGMLDERGRKTVLESLVAARAISQVQEAAMSDAEKAAVDKQVAAFREQLLVKRYLAANSPPMPVTREMVEAYYKKHPEQYGAKTIKDYELISAPGPLEDARRDQLLAALQGADGQKDWRGWTRRLKQKDLPVSYAGGSVQAEVLTGRMRELLASLKAGDKSSISLIDGGVYLARITGERRIAPRPLDQVSAQIRKTLMPAQIKKTVKQASAAVLKDAQVEYLQK